MKLAVVGSRDFSDSETMARVLDRIRAKHPQVTIVSGAGRGADTLAANYAKANGLTLIEFPADWNKHGRAAGPIRNQQVVDASDAVLAFWDGQSPGTKITIDMARRKGIPVRIVKPSGEEE